jgi:hypothetical protein
MPYVTKPLHLTDFPTGFLLDAIPQLKQDSSLRDPFHPE